MDKYEQHDIENVLKLLNDEQSLLLIGLSLAANDLVLNHDLICRSKDNENICFFSNSISIIRELAKLVVAVDGSGLTGVFSKDTKDCFGQLKHELKPFDDKSLAKMVLKPIRDISFHYDLTNSDQKDKITPVLDELRKKDSIALEFLLGNDSPQGVRYAYANSFRSNLINQFLTMETTSRISSVAVNVGCFVDSLVNDLLLKVRTL